jgi:hypothetical protein
VLGGMLGWQTDVVESQAAAVNKYRIREIR